MWIAILWLCIGLLAPLAASVYWIATKRVRWRERDAILLFFCILYLPVIYLFAVGWALTRAAIMGISFYSMEFFVHLVLCRMLKSTSDRTTIRYILLLFFASPLVHYLAVVTSENLWITFLR